MSILTGLLFDLLVFERGYLFFLVFMQTEQKGSISIKMAAMFFEITRALSHSKSRFSFLYYLPKLKHIKLK